MPCIHLPDARGVDAEQSTVQGRRWNVATDSRLFDLT